MNYWIREVMNEWMWLSVVRNSQMFKDKKQCTLIYNLTKQNEFMNESSFRHIVKASVRKNQNSKIGFGSIIWERKTLY